MSQKTALTPKCVRPYKWKIRCRLVTSLNPYMVLSRASLFTLKIPWQFTRESKHRVTKFEGQPRPMRRLLVKIKIQNSPWENNWSKFSRQLRCFLSRASTAFNFLVEKKRYAVPKMSSKHRKNTSVSLSMSNLLEEPLQFAAVLIMTTLFIFAHTLGILFSIYVLLTPLYGFMVIYLLWTYCFDMKTPSKGGRRYEAFRRLKTWDYFRDYFPVRLIRTKRLDPNKNYILGYHPHGIMCAGAWANFATEATGFSDLFPGIKSHLLTLKCKSHIYLFYFFLIPYMLTHIRLR